MLNMHGLNECEVGTSTSLLLYESTAHLVSSGPVVQDMEDSLVPPRDGLESKLN